MSFERVEQLANLSARVASGFARWLAAPPSELIAPPGARRTGTHYLFRAEMSAAQVRDTISVLHGMFEVLVAAEYLERNPFGVTARGKFAPRKKPDPKALNQRAWGIYLQASANLEPRMRWFAALAYHLLLRRSEAAALSWADFTPDPQDATGRGWQVRVRGKGGTDEPLPLARAAAEEMTRWRLSIGVAPFPAVGVISVSVQKVPLSSKGQP